MTTVMLRTSVSSPVEIIDEGTLLALIARLPDRTMAAGLTSAFHTALARPLDLGNVALTVTAGEWTALAETFQRHQGEI
jgi:hypothetical protein